MVKLIGKHLEKMMHLKVGTKLHGLVRAKQPPSIARQWLTLCKRDSSPSLHHQLQKPETRLGLQAEIQGSTWLTQILKHTMSNSRVSEM